MTARSPRRPARPFRSLCALALILAAPAAASLALAEQDPAEQEGAPIAAEPASEPLDLRRDGAFGFPQRAARVLCDLEALRFSVFCDGRFLYAQAVLWTDGDDALGETSDGRAIGDWSALLLDVDGDGAVTPEVDRSYSLNPWPTFPGVRYTVELGNGASTGIQTDSTSRGAIRYLPDVSGARVRVDSFLIPLADLELEPGDAIRLAYWGSSQEPELVVNSVGFEAEGHYWSFQLPRERWHALELAAAETLILPDAVPDGRQDDVPDAVKPPPLAKLPEVGAAPPELVAEDWLHTGGPLTLAGLKGKVLVVEFWATWCGPCVKGIPHLVELHEKHHADGLRIVSFTDQSREVVEAFLEKTAMPYALGVGSRLSRAYGVTGIPHAFVVGRDGLLRWHGHPATAAFDQAIAAALAE